MERNIQKIFASVQKKDKKQRLSGEVKDWIQGMILSVFYRFVHGGVTMLECRQQKTLDDDDIRAVASMILIGDLAIETVGFVDKVCAKYASEKKKMEKLLLPPSSIRTMLMTNLDTYKKGIRLRPLTPVALAAVLEHLIREIFLTTSQSTSATLSKEEVLAALAHHKDLHNTLCATGML
jgi:hypothetical protein